MNKKTPIFIALVCAFVQTFIALGDYVPNPHEPNWPVTLGPEDECEEVVAYLKDSVDSIVRDLSGFETYTNDLSYSHQQIYEMAAASPAYTNDESYSQNLYYYNDVFQNAMILCARDLKYANDIATNLLDDVYQINCADCVMGDPPEGPTNSNACCDFTDLYARLDQLISIQNAIKTQAQRLSQIQSLLTAIKQQLLVDDFNVYEYSDYYAKFLDGDPVTTFSFLPYDPTIGNYLMATSLTLAEAIPSLNNYHYGFNHILWPSFTNEFNYVSSFFKQSKVQSPLLNFGNQSQYTDYYTYLTNYYFGMIRGDDDIPINQRTNWFTRIETLLAALVFPEGSNVDTNTVDTAAGEQERTQLKDSIEIAGQYAEAQSHLFKSSSQSITQLYRSYFTVFDTAAMPSHIVLMRLSSNEAEDIEIAFQSDSLGILVEACRLVTTFAWASVGILLLYKFLVWSSRCIFVACQFIYRVISSVFKS